MEKENKIDWKVLVLCLIIIYSVGFIGTIFSFGNTDSEWYNSIRPEITPPGYVFPIVWNVLFFMIGLSLFFSWTNSKDPKNKIKIIISFGINFFLNAIWSLFYFGLKSPGSAFFILFLLWVSIIFMFVVSYKIKKISGYLLIPYFFWVSFAGILNYLSL